MLASRNRAGELLKEGKADEFRKVQLEEVVPDYDKYLKAIDLDVDFNEKLAKTYADDGKSSRSAERPFDRGCFGSRPTHGYRPRLDRHPLHQPCSQ